MVGVLAARPRPASALQRVVTPATTPLVIVAAAVSAGVAAGTDPRLGVAVIAAFAGALLILSRPQVGGYLLLGLVPVTVGLRRGYPIPGLRFSEVLLVGISLSVLIPAVATARTRWRAVDWAALVFVVLNVVLSFANLFIRYLPPDADLVGKAFGPLQFLLLYRAVVVALPTAAFRRRAVVIMLATAVPVAALAVMQQLGIGNVRELILQLTASTSLQSASFVSLPRGSGPFAHWHSLGGYLVVIGAIAIALLCVRDQRVMSRRGLAVVLIACALGLAATLTMAVVIGAVAVSLIVGFRTRQGMKILAGIALAVSVSALALGPSLERRFDRQFDVQSTQAGGPTFLPQTVAFRVGVWVDDYVPAVVENLPFGYGPGVPPSVRWKFTESLYISLLLRGGFMLMAAYVVLAVAMFRRAERAAADDDPEQRAFGLALSAVIVVSIALHFVHPYFTDAGYPHALWGLLGIIAARGAAEAST